MKQWYKSRACHFCKKKCMCQISYYTKSHLCMALYILLLLFLMVPSLSSHHPQCTFMFPYGTFIIISLSLMVPSWSPIMLLPFWYHMVPSWSFQDLSLYLHGPSWYLQSIVVVAFCLHLCQISIRLFLISYMFVFTTLMPNMSVWFIPKLFHS